MKRLVLYLAAVLGIGAFLIMTWYHARPHSAPAQAAAATGAQPGAKTRVPLGRDPGLSSVRGAMIALRSELGELRETHDQLGREVEAMAQAGEDPEDLHAPSDEEVIAQLLTTFDDHLENEPVDSEWADDVSSQLDTAFASPELKGASLANARCGATLCRAEVHFEDSESRVAATELIPQKAPFDSDGFIHVEGEDDLEVVVYFSRQGHPLPAPGLE